MKIQEILNLGIEKLSSSNIEETSLKAKMLLSDILKVNKEYFIIHLEEEIDKEKEDEFFQKMEMLSRSIPIQYILKKQEFMGLEFYVDENVLIPQPDTEILVCEVLEILKDKKNAKVLDMCTGSGIIAISLAKKINTLNVVGADISQSALDIAVKNAKKLEVRSRFIKSNLFNSILEKEFDIIVSNPPYIKTKIIKNLSLEVQKEPKIALDGGEDGLYFYRKIILEARKYLKEGGYLALEIGYDQKEEVLELLKRNEYKNIYSKKDYSGNDRIVISQK